MLLDNLFMNKVVLDESGCWLWTGATVRGYGSLSRRGQSKRTLSAHRYSWEMFEGHIPKGLWVLHKCDVRSCVNPDHMFLGTQAENNLDMFRKGRNISGESHPSAKLTREDVEQITNLCARGLTQAAVAQRFGVVQSVVSNIITGKRWKS